MTPEALVVVALLLGVLVLLATTRLPPDAILLTGLTLLLAVPVPTEAGWTVGALSPGDALAGFANPGLATVGVLFVTVCGLRSTGAIDWIAQTVLGRPRGLRSALVRLMAPTAAMSAFLNNTPVVAMTIPAVQDWARKLDLAPSKLLIPLSYAAILGGTCTLIGTSTNLVVAGLVQTETDLAPIGMFDVTRIGLPVLLVGGTFLLLIGPKLLPDRRSPQASLSATQEYTLELLVPQGSPLHGKSVEAAGLRNLPGCFLVELERDGELVAAVGPEQVLHEGDRLVFAGVVESIVELQRMRGLAPATNQIFKLDSPRHRRRLFEAVVGPRHPAVGRTIKEARFRNRYDAAVIAVARNGERVPGKLGEIQVRQGDVLLVEADPGFRSRHRQPGDFLLVRALEDSTPRNHDRAPLAVAILAGMVALAASGLYPMLVAALLAAGAMLATRCCTIADARASVDWSVLIVIGAALGFGAALQQSGAANVLAVGVLSVAGDHPWLALAAVYLACSVLTEVVTNNAAVAILFPIALNTSERLDVSFLPFAMALLLAGSASFATPLGYQTNLMVYGPGGYTLRDFLRIGVPMNLLVGVTAVTLAPLLFPF